MLRFHLDENVDRAIAIGLRSHIVDVTTTPDADLCGASDAEQIEYCLSVGRVIVSHDPDMVDLHWHALPHSGITWCRNGTRTVGQIVRRLIFFSQNHSPADFLNRLEFL